MQIEQSPSRNSIKKASGKTARPRKTVLGWPDILRAVPRDAARSFVLDLYRFTGSTPDDFAHVRKAREAMADALCRTEDWIESEHPGWKGDGPPIREVRARFEPWYKRPASARDRTMAVNTRNAACRERARRVTRGKCAKRIRIWVSCSQLYSRGLAGNDVFATLGTDGRS